MPKQTDYRIINALIEIKKMLERYPRPKSSHITVIIEWLNPFWKMFQQHWTYAIAFFLFNKEINTVALIEASVMDSIYYGVPMGGYRYWRPKGAQIGSMVLAADGRFYRAGAMTIVAPNFGSDEFPMCEIKDLTKHAVYTLLDNFVSKSLNNGSILIHNRKKWLSDIWKLFSENDKFFSIFDLICAKYEIELSMKDTILMDVAYFGVDFEYILSYGFTPLIRNNNKPINVHPIYSLYWSD